MEPEPRTRHRRLYPVFNQTSAENAAVSLHLLASNPGGGPLTYSATGLPPSLTVNAGTGVISGTPPFGSAGIYSVTAAVSDGSLTSSKTFTWTVTAVTQAPIVTGLSQTSGPVGTPVTISGANFGTRQGMSTVTFNGTAATPTTWAATSIVVPVPVGATTGVVVVTVGGVASNGVVFKVASKPGAPPNLRIAGGQQYESVTLRAAEGRLDRLARITARWIRSRVIEQIVSGHRAFSR
jgi:hypothetical protein